MPAGRAFKMIGGWSLAVAIIFGVSYCTESPKYRFERVAVEVGRGMPGARLIDSFKSGDLTSPVSWFWPATTTWNFASPDPVMTDRFYTLTLVYEQEPMVLLLDADCEARDAILYDLDAPDSGIPARNIWGEPVVAPNGRTYRRIEIERDLPAVWLQAFCDADWTAERRAAAVAISSPNRPAP